MLRNSHVLSSHMLKCTVKRTVNRQSERERAESGREEEKATFYTILSESGPIRHHPRSIHRCPIRLLRLLLPFRESVGDRFVGLELELELEDLQAQAPEYRSHSHGHLFLDLPVHGLGHHLFDCPVELVDLILDVVADGHVDDLQHHGLDLDLDLDLDLGLCRQQARIFDVAVELRRPDEQLLGSPLEVAVLLGAEQEPLAEQPKLAGRFRARPVHHRHHRRRHQESRAEEQGRQDVREQEVQDEVLLEIGGASPPRLHRPPPTPKVACSSFLPPN